MEEDKKIDDLLSKIEKELIELKIIVLMLQIC